MNVITKIENITRIKNKFNPFLRSFFKQYHMEILDYYEQPKLGRWSIHYDEKIIHCKVDQANEDHCGCCVNEFEKIEKNENYKETEEYLRFYCL